LEQRREILRAIWSFTNTDSYADTKSYSYSMHREMHTNAKAASYSRAAALAHSIRVLLSQASSDAVVR
jgi:hypothetical protein